jgi:hypothetical protein
MLLLHIFFVPLYLYKSNKNMENSYRLPVTSYGRMELAQIYFPHICGRAAWRKLKDCMAEYPELDPLLAINRRTFLPLEVERIFRNLGVPTRSA